MLALGAKAVIDDIHTFETAPGPWYGYAHTSVFHLAPFPGRLLWWVSGVAALGLAGVALVCWALANEQEVAGKAAVLMTALVWIPCLFVMTVAYHDTLISTCDAHHICDTATGQPLDAPGVW
jgi:hypothetical protein